MNDVLNTVMQTKYRITEVEAIDRIEQARGKTAEQAVIHQAERLTIEINEFITALNAHATETEREIFAKIK